MNPVDEAIGEDEEPDERHDEVGYAVFVDARVETRKAAHLGQHTRSGDNYSKGHERVTEACRRTLSKDAVATTEESDGSM